LLGTSTSAFALDGYQDRRGLFAGVGVGGGVGSVGVDQSDERTGIDRGRKAGLHLNAIFGGGATDRLVLGGEANLWQRTVVVNEDSLSHSHWSFNAVADLFVLDGIFVEVGGGLAYGAFQAQEAGQELVRYQELGFAAKAGGGFEFFVNSQVAIGMRVGYTRHFYSNSDFDTIAGGFSVRWY
jgi:hypothetical protein